MALSFMPEELIYGPSISRKQAKEQGLTQYFTGKPCKHGHIEPRNTCDGQCRECARQKYRRWAEKNDRTEYTKNYERQNLKHRSAQRLVWYHKNGGSPGRIARRKDPDAHKQTRADWRKKNRTKIREYERNYIRENIDARLARSLRNRLNSALLADKRGPYKTNGAIKLLGCTWQEFLQHIAAQFTPGMIWENYGLWHIDHIRPCSSFDLTDPEQQKKCFHYKNLQPLWATDNFKKSGRWFDEDC
jgi:hypothetical protein